MDEQQALRLAREAIKQGDKAGARKLLFQAIQANPRSETAWLWLSAIIDDRDKERDCLNRVLAINSDNEIAQRYLAELDQAERPAPQPVPEPPPEPPPAPQPLPAPPPAPVQRPSQPAKPPTKPKRQDATIRASALNGARLEITKGESRSRLMTKGRRVVLIGAVLLIAGALLPWVSITSIFGKISKAGYEGDGLFTGGIGLLLLISALLAEGKSGRRYSVAASIFAVIAGLIAVWDLSNVALVVSESNGTEGVIASIGAGLYITVVGAILAFIGGLIKLPLEPESEPAQAIELGPESGPMQSPEKPAE